MSIDVGLSPLALTFARRMKANNKPVPTTRKPPLVMSSTDLKDIADLRKAGNEWLEIAKLQFKGYKSPKTGAQCIFATNLTIPARSTS